jgi:uncharacterized protein (TIGR03083 family)
MTSLADRTIAALRATHDDLAEVAAKLTDDQLTSRSGASEWTVAQVLSHLGSGGEISLATLQAALTDAPRPGQDFNHQVWDRWNALAPREQASGFLTQDEELVVTLEGLTAEQREGLQIDLGFLPAPVSLTTYLGMRLNEAAQHSWDARVAVDPDAGIAADTAAILAELFASDLSFLLGFSSKPDALAQPAVVAIAGSGFTLSIADSVSLAASGAEPTATFTGPLESTIRMLAGRLTADYTPDGVDVTGNVGLDDLRRVFPGY